MNKTPIAIKPLMDSNRVLSVNWNLSKKCNFDCSYCSPFIHDAVSPGIDLDIAKTFISNCDSVIAKNNAQIKWHFAGGEPFVDPALIDLLEYVRNKPTTKFVSTISNGSLPYEKYQASLKYIDSLTFSLHLERSQDEIQKTIDKIIKLKQQTDIDVSAHVMFLPGKSELVQHIYNTLKLHDINIVVRKIDPPLDEDLVPFVKTGPGRKDLVAKESTEQQALGVMYKIKTAETRLDRLSTYYTQAEQQLLQQLNKEHEFQDAGVWWSDQSQSDINVDNLIANDQHSFFRWICFAGVDALYIHSNGLIYRGMCGNRGAIGHIQQPFDISNIKPTICDYQYCNCAADIRVRKCSRSKYLNLIV